MHYVLIFQAYGQQPISALQRANVHETIKQISTSYNEGYFPIHNYQPLLRNITIIYPVWEQRKKKMQANN